RAGRSREGRPSRPGWLVLGVDRAAHREAGPARDRRGKRTGRRGQRRDDRRPDRDVGPALKGERGRWAYGSERPRQHSMRGVAGRGRPSGSYAQAVVGGNAHLSDTLSWLRAAHG